MALSNRCFEALDDLAKGFVVETDRGYDSGDLSKLVDAMFVFADFIATHDLPPLPSSKKHIKPYANNLLVGLLIKRVTPLKASHFLAVMAELCGINKRLAKAVDQVFGSSDDPQNLFEHLKHASIIERLEVIQKRIDSAKTKNWPSPKKLK